MSINIAMPTSVALDAHATVNSECVGIFFHKKTRKLNLLKLIIIQ